MHRHLITIKLGGVVVATVKVSDEGVVVELEQGELTIPAPFALTATHVEAWEDDEETATDSASD